MVLQRTKVLENNLLQPHAQTTGRPRNGYRVFTCLNKVITKLKQTWPENKLDNSVL